MVFIKLGTLALDEPKINNFSQNKKHLIFLSFFYELISNNDLILGERFGIIELNIGMQKRVLFRGNLQVEIFFISILVKRTYYL